MKRHEMIELKNISKTFKIARRNAGFGEAAKAFFHKEYEYVKALDNITFTIPEGEMVGYIGPNGAGKSCTIKIMSGILNPDGGTCVINGRTPWKDRINHAKEIGVVFGQRSQLWWDVPVVDSFELLKDIYKIDEKQWLQQSFLALFMAWFFDNEIFDSISSGNVAYELCRPTGLYEMWFVRSLSSRIYRVVLRCSPILIVAAFLPAPYGISLPVDIMAFFLFILSLALGSFLMVSINMLIYASTFYTISPMGIRILSVSIFELFSGAIIPLPFLPDNVHRIFNLLPFASTQNTPFLIYNGYLSGKSVFHALLLQIAWLFTFVLFGKLLFRDALKKVVVQGG
jgi:ABC-2 type transport system permease protein